MPPKHVINEEHQGALFADPARHEGAMSVDVPLTDIDGGIYPDLNQRVSALEVPITSPEQVEIIDASKPSNKLLRP